MKYINQKQNGFTLVELLITVLIGSILLAWGLPNYANLKSSREVTEYANEMVYSFTLAKAEAVRRGINIDVAATGSWQNGWTIKAGTDNLAIQDAPDPKVLITQTGTLGPFAFSNIGGLVGGSPITFQVRHSSNPNARRNVLISPSGSARVVRL